MPTDNSSVNAAPNAAPNINNVSLFELASRFPEYSIKVRGTSTMQSISSELEQAALRSSGAGVFYSGFQRLSSFPPQAATYRKLGQHLQGVYACGISDRELEPIANVHYLALSQLAPLTGEWFIVYNAPDFYATLLTRDNSGSALPYAQRRFEGILSFDEQVVAAAEQLIAQAVGLDHTPANQRQEGQRRAQQSQVNSITDQVLGRLEQSNRTLQAAYNQVSELNAENQRIQGLLRGLLAQETWQSVNAAAQSGSKLIAAQSVMVSVLFTDIVGFTSISERFSPDTVVAMLNRYFSLLAPIVYRYGGDIDKYPGDGLMATFSAAKDALAAGREMLQAVADFNEGQQLFDRPPLETRIGIASGRAILGSIGGQERMDRTYIGDAVNVAARLENLAAASSLLISAEAWAQAGSPAGYTRREGLTIKGKREPLQAYEYKGGDEDNDRA